MDQVQGGKADERLGYVYFVREVRKDGKGRIKIGWSEFSPNTRFGDLNVGSPRDLEKFALMRAPFSHEGVLHKRFAKYRRRGEWFHPHASLLAYIAENARDWKELLAEEKGRAEAASSEKYARDIAEMRRQYRRIEDHQSSCWMLGKDLNKTPMPPEPDQNDPKPRRKSGPGGGRLRYGPLQKMLDAIAADKPKPP